MNANTDDVQARAVHLAAADVLQRETSRLQADDPEAAAGLARALKAGAMLKMVATFAPSVGLAHHELQALLPNGETWVIWAREFRREAQG